MVLFFRLHTRKESLRSSGTTADLFRVTKAAHLDVDAKAPCIPKKNVERTSEKI